MPQESPLPENWGEIEAIDWTTRPEKADDPDVPELTWDAKKEDIDGVTGRKVEPLEMSKEERAKLDEARRKIYRDHNNDSGEQLAA